MTYARGPILLRLIQEIATGIFSFAFAKLAKAKGNMIPDAYLAALVPETGGEWITTDGDYARFPGLRWRRPF